MLSFLLFAVSSVGKHVVRRPAGWPDFDALAARLFAGERRMLALFGACAAALTLEYALEMRLVAQAIRMQPRPLGWFADMPLETFVHSSEDPWLCNAVQLCGWLESLTLVAAYATLRRVPPERAKPAYAMAAVCALALAALSILQPTTTSEDIYLYVGSAEAVPSAYAPNAVLFAGADRVINHLWGNPLFSSVYGPLWIAASKATASLAGPFLVARLLALRWLGLASLALIVACLVRAKVRADAIVLIAVNPGIYELYVSDAHNDLFGVAFVMLAFLARRSTLLASACIAAAACVKFPIAAAGLLVFYTRESRVERLVAAAAAAVASFGALWAFGGPQYFRSVANGAALEPHVQSVFQVPVHVLAVAVALGGVAYALWTGRLPQRTAWTFPMLGVLPLQAYLAWGLPAAVLGAFPAIEFLCAIPAASFTLTTLFESTPLFAVWRATLLCGLMLVLGLYVVRMRRQGLRPTTSI